jgi:methylenetetrahydrofolate reductase (NADPH)
MEEEQIRYEIMPSGAIVQDCEKLPTGHPVAVTMSTTYGVSRTMEVLKELASQGYEVLPHIAARMIPDAETLENIHTQLEECNISSVFIPGGDAETPAGPFESSYELIRKLHDDFSPSYDVGITGYPEGHEFITDAELRDSIRKKCQLSDYIVSHICFSPSKINEWCDSLSEAGITLPVFCCVPTAMPRAKLQHISKLIGVGKSSHSLSSNSKPEVSANDPLYRPTKLIKQLVATGQISGFHISTFNRLSATRQFHRTHIASESSIKLSS